MREENRLTTLQGDEDSHADSETERIVRAESSGQGEDQDEIFGETSTTV